MQVLLVPLLTQVVADFLLVLLHSHRDQDVDRFENQSVHLEHHHELVDDRCHGLLAALRLIYAGLACRDSSLG